MTASNMWKKAMKLKNKKIPMRRCVGCMESKPKGSLIRIACYEDNITVDPTGKAKGRGVYLCPDRECMEKAKKSSEKFRKRDFRGGDEDSVHGAGKI